ncbi:MAG: site-specific integrase [Pseudomonadota bacterium]
MTFAQAAKHVWKTQVLPKARNEKAAHQWLTTIETYANPEIGRTPVAEVDSGSIIAVLEPIWLSKEETARRVRQRMSTVFRWAIVAGKRTAADPTTNVESGLARQKGKAAVRHHRAIAWQDTPSVYSQIAAAKGTGARALAFGILCASRSGEVRGATWDEIDLEARIWCIPSDRMKMNRDHRVPLSQPAMDLLRGQMGLDDVLVFPASRRGRTVSDMTLSAVLKRLGIGATPHGFRTSFRTWCAEATDTPREVAELALAHVTGSAVERAYARTDHYERRIPLMMKWAEFLTTSATQEKVIDLAAAR